MGSLNLKKNISTSLATKTGGMYFIIFKGPAGITFGDFFNPGTASIINSGGSYNFYFNGDLNNPTTYLTDAIDWYDAIGLNIVTNNIIPIDTILQIESDFVDYVIDFGGNIQNYFSGKTSIKKQNLTKLKSGFFFNQQESTYIFRSATNNTLAQIFNPNQFEAYTDSLTLYDINLNPLNSFFTDGSSWLYDDFTTNADNYVLPANTILTFSTSINFDINVGGGAIIQKYYGGKLSLKSSAIPLNILNIRVNNGPTNSPWGVGGSGPCGNDFQLLNNQNGIWSQSNLGCDFFIAWDNQYGNLPYKWRMYYDSDGRTDYAFHPTAGPEALPSKGWSNEMTITAI